MTVGLLLRFRSICETSDEKTAARYRLVRPVAKASPPSVLILSSTLSMGEFPTRKYSHRRRQKNWAKSLGQEESSPLALGDNYRVSGLVGTGLMTI